MATEKVVISSEELRGFIRKVFEKMGFSPGDAETGANSLIWANLRGVDSHGVQRIALLARFLKEGNLNPNPNISVVRELPAVALIDADRAFGAISATFAMKKSIEKAKKTGIGWTVIRNTVTPLAIGQYVQIAINEGMAGIAATFARPLMAPYGAKEIGLHNGPISIGVPASKHKPALLDMATSTVAFGKIEVAMDKKEPIPGDWGLERDGTPTNDPFKAKIMLPFGKYKGSGLSFMFECLTGIMAGDPLCAPWILDRNNDPRHRQNSIMAAIDISAFTDLGRFRENVDDLIDGVKGLKKTDDIEEIYVPGEIEERVTQKRVKEGIPLPAGTVAKLRDAAEQFGVALPPTLEKEGI